MERYSFETVIAKAFIFFLPFRMISILTPAVGFLGAQGEYFSFFFHALGIVMFLLRNRGKVSLEKRSTSDILGLFVR